MVFATITAEGYVNPTTKAEEKCMFNGTDSACNYGVGIGVLAFLACVIFLILDAYFPQISNAKERKFIVLADLVFSGESEVSLLIAHIKIKELCLKTGSAALLKLTLSACFVCFDVFIAGQRRGHSCGSSASVSWPTSGPKHPQAT